jgi:parallel beta-helix repeat protein
MQGISLSRYSRRALLFGAILLACIAFSSSKAFASHVQCDDTITEDTTLDSDLLNCPFDGITIGADNITLDLNGHTVRSDSGIPSGFGVENRGHEGVTIENGTIQGFVFGVLLDEVTGNRVHGLTTEGSGYGVILFASDDNRIDENVVSRSRGGGIDIVDDPHGGVFFGSDRNVVERNVVSGTGIDAIAVSGTTTSGALSRDNTIVRNLVLDSGSEAIQIFYGPGAIISRNSIVASGTRAAGTNAIFVASSPDSTITRNSVVRGNDSGISVFADRTGVERNRVSESDFFGITVSGAGTIVERNVATYNGLDGIRVGASPPEQPPLTVTKNTAAYNANLGILAVTGVIDGGGNRAFGNGNPLQCLNVACK